MPSSPRRPHGAPLAFVQPAFSSQAGSLILAAPAKLNLFLEITGKRPDGYHNIETLMVSVDLFDTLELQANTTGTITLECDPPGLPTSSDNLVVKAAEKLKAACGFAARDLGASVRLTKRIPTQAGLAGGSSDAAATILGLNRLWNLNLSKFELANVAADVGSDVAFFLDLPAAWCTGRGEIVVPELLQTTLHFVLVCPPVGLGTADVYRALPPLAASQTMPAEKTQAALRYPRRFALQPPPGPRIWACSACRVRVSPPPFAEPRRMPDVRQRVERVRPLPRPGRCRARRRGVPRTNPGRRT
jgi:4-diphosphocytidyl-2-C-methyl-D-erythritol kinase